MLAGIGVAEFLVAGRLASGGCNMTRAVRALLMLVMMQACGVAWAQSTLTAYAGQMMPWELDTGILTNGEGAARVILSHEIRVPGAGWVRLYFGPTELPEGSWVRLTAEGDGEVQWLDGRALDAWQDSSAYFNGEAVRLDVVGGAATTGIRVRVARVSVGVFVEPAGDPGSCGICGVDDRVTSAEGWSGRVLPVGCTASLYCESGTSMITAGHCLEGQSSLVVQFHVPPSRADCVLVHPPVADQFPVSSFEVHEDMGPGRDWGVFEPGVNGLGETPFERYGAYRPLASSVMATGDEVTIHGYGADTTCVRRQTQQRSDGVVGSVGENSFDFFADIRGGVSGAAVLNEAGEIVGVVTHCRVGCPNIAQRVDFPGFFDARVAINPACALGHPQPNAFDACEGALVLSVGESVTGSTSEATPDGAACVGSGSGDVWYAFTPPCGGGYRFTTCLGASWNTVISVHRGCPGTTANMVACADNGCGAQTVLDVPLEGGETYLVRVGGGAESERGPFVLSSWVIAAEPAGNDACTGAVEVSLGEAVVGTTLCASAGEAAECGTSVGEADLWYSFTAPEAGFYGAAADGSGVPWAVTVYRDCGADAGSRVACGSSGGRAVWYQEGGATYLARVAGSEGLRGEFRLVVEAEVNDECEQMIALGEGTFGFHTLGATTGEGSWAGCEPGAAGEIYGDVWFSVIAGARGRLQIDTCGSGFDTRLAVYAGACTGGVPTVCDDNACWPHSLVSMAVEVGDQLLIRVGGAGDERGRGVIRVTSQGECGWRAGGCFADFTGDGRIDGDDTVAFFGAWDAGLPCGDTSGDGAVDSDDVIAYFGCWEGSGAGCQGC